MIDFLDPIDAFQPDPLGRLKLHKGGGSSTSSTKVELPAWADPYGEKILTDNFDMMGEVVNPYEGMKTYAGPNDYQKNVIGYAEDAGLRNYHAMGDMYGDYASGKIKNQGMELAGRGVNVQGVDENRWIGAHNKYAGDSPYLDRMIGNTMGDVTEEYLNTVTPQMAAMERASGAFGNSGLNELKANAMDDYMDTLGDISGGMRQQQFETTQGLEQQRLNNALSGTQADLSNQLQVNLAQAGYNNQAIDRQLNQFNYGNQNQLDAMQGITRNQLDMTDAGMAIGDFYRQAEQGALDDAMMHKFAEVNAPYDAINRQIQLLTGAVGQQGVTTATGSNPYNPVTAGLGLLSMGGGLFGS